MLREIKVLQKTQHMFIAQVRRDADETQIRELSLQV